MAYYYIGTMAPKQGPIV